MRLLYIVISTVLAFMSPAAAADYEVGQVWNYETRVSESGSTLTVVKIDARETHRVIHISVQGLKMQDPYSETGLKGQLLHLPMLEQALDDSTTYLSGTAQSLPPFEEDYEKWYNLFGATQTGFFSCPVALCIEHMEKALAQSKAE